MNKDTASTLAGGGAGVALLLTVNWTAVPFGECVKIGVALILIVAGILLYRGEAK
jgi:hypothetical protein